jgi:sugar phosphate isomerase/epimerase
MSNRRSFIKKTSAAALSAALLQSKLFAETFGTKAKEITAGVQLFTFFSVMDSDVPGTLKKIADIGYKEIESAYSNKGKYYGLEAKDFKNLVASFGMTWQSQHVLGAPFVPPPGFKMPTMPDGKPMVLPKLRNLKENMQEIVDELAAVNLPYMVCANISTDTLDDIKSSIDILNKTGEACKKAGITFAYHNHDMEFKEVDGKIPYDLLLSETDPLNVKMELDLAWVTKAGKNPIDLLRKNPGRFPLWHVKDIAKDLTTLEPVGEGVVPFKAIFAHATMAGMKHYFVEHDMPANPFASITTSFNNLKKLV